MSRRVWRRSVAALGTAVVVAVTAEALSGPYWWNTRGVVDTNSPPGDFSPANQGQAKWMATQAAAEFDAYLPGGSGAAVSNLLAGFSTTNNWLPLNLGQLKTLATPFYDRLAEAGITGALPPGVTGAYPWTSEAGDDADFAMANLGQLKFVFSFDLDRPLNVDRDEDGLPDWWEMEYWTSLEESGNEDDPDEDGYLNEDEYYAGTDPTDADSHPWDVSGLVTYSGAQTGTVYVVGLDAAGNIVASTVADAAGYYRMCRLPVGGEYDIRAFLDSDCTTTQDFGEAWAQWPSTLTLTQDVADVDLELADPDSDGDGLPDYWEELYGLDPLNGGAADACAWWKLDETSGTNVFDSTEGASTGTVQNATAPGWTNGVIGGALLSDGVDDVVTVPDGDWLNPIYVTVSFWLRAETALTNVAFVSKKDPGAASGYEVGYTNGQLRFAVGATSEKALLASCTLTNGGWYHVAAVYGGATQSLYLNGVRVALTNFSLGTSMGGMGASTNILTLGAASPAAARPFAGMLDDVRIYPSELSSNAVVAIWQLGQDVDGDGLGALVEFQAGASPAQQDTDGDGLDDWDEFYTYGTKSWRRDSDGDGLEDGTELLEIGTSPLSVNPVVDLASTQVAVEYKMVASQRHKCGFGSLSETNLLLFYLEAGRTEDTISGTVPWTYFYRTGITQDDSHTTSHAMNPTNGLWLSEGSDTEQSFWTDTGSGDYSRVIGNSWHYTNTAPWGATQTLIRPGQYHTGSGTVSSNVPPFQAWTNATDWWSGWGGSAGVQGLLAWSYVTNAHVPKNLDYEGNGEDETGGEGTLTLAEYRDIEFTTPMLVAFATGDLARTSWTQVNWGQRSHWVNNNNSVVSNSFVGWERPQTWVALRWQSPNQATQQLASLLYRLRVLSAESGTVYRMSVCHLFTPDGTTNSELTAVGNYVGVCTNGGTNFHLAASGALLEAPSSNGTVRLDWPTVTLANVAGLRSETVGDFSAVTNPHSAGRVFVDTTEDWDGGSLNTNDFNRQRVVLTATVDLKGVATNGCFIRWALYDPDDPATNVWADPPKNEDGVETSVGGGDNFGAGHEGDSAHWFNTVSGQAITAWSNDVPEQPSTTGVLVETADCPVIDLGDGQFGASTVLNLSDDGGDNYRVQAHLVLLGTPVAADASGLWTMWRKRCVTAHAMTWGTNLFYPSQEGTREGLEEALRGAFSDGDPEYACYLDVVVSNGNLALPYVELLHSEDTTGIYAYEWNNYLWTNLHSLSVAHAVGTYHAIGVDGLWCLGAKPTNIAGTAISAPDFGVAAGYIANNEYMISNEVSISTVTIHEMGHTTTCLGDPDLHGAHAFGMKADPSCAFTTIRKGACDTERICIKHCVSVRDSISRAWPVHQPNEERRAATYDSSRTGRRR